MKMYGKLIFIVVTMMLIFLPHQHVWAEAPYYTYTSDSQDRLIKTQTAYVPSDQVLRINGQRLQVPEHVYIDDEDFVYITDSALNTVFILDENFQYYQELTSDQFTSVQSTFVTEEYIYVVDSGQSKILLFDKKSHDFVREIGQPDSPIFSEGYSFSPTHIVVDVRGNLYVRSSGSINGLIMLNREGEFITFFGANPLNVPLTEQLRTLLLTEAQKLKMERTFPDVPSNLAIDNKGFIYTVTSSIEENPISKLNVSGTNYFQDDLVATFNMESIWVGQHNTIYTVTSDGWIFEYDAEGNLLFLFGGSNVNSSQYGLLNRPISIATNSKDEVIVVDQGASLIQIYQTSHFTDAVHEAMGAYQAGDYNKSKELWEYTMQFNSTFDNAHIGLGDAYLREGEPLKAYSEFMDATDNEGISEAFWEIRQQWLTDNLNKIFIFLLTFGIVYTAHKLLNRHYQYGPKVVERLQVVRNIKLIDDLFYIFTYVKKPLNSIYEIQDKNRVAKSSAFTIYVLLGVIFIAYHLYTNILFVPKNEHILYEFSILVFLFILWLLSNYLISSINDGEGSFTHVFKSTAYAFSPVLLIMPFIILFSNGLTLEQSVFYYLPIQGMFIWTGFLLFFTIKDIHNYDVSETLSVIFKSLFTMLIIGLFLFVLYSLGNQMVEMIVDVVREVAERW